MNNDVKSAGRILEVLETLARATGPMTLRDVVSELGYPRSSTYNLLQTLIGRGYAVREEPERYRLNDACRSGPGWTSGRDAQLIAVAQPVMQKLRDELNESVFLGVRAQRGRVKLIAKYVSTATVRYDSDLLGAIPSYCSATGRVLLAYGDPKFIDEYLGFERLIAHTDKTVTNRSEIRRIIAEVRVNGYAVSDEEIEIGGSGVAAPIHDTAGKVVATLNIATPSPRFGLKREAIIAAMLRAVGEISHRNGYRPKPDGEPA
jgi:DNA-binding IclR family transcriptional regulator